MASSVNQIGYISCHH